MSGKFQSMLLGGLVTGILAAAFYVVQFSYYSEVLGYVSCCVLPTIGALLAVWHFTSTNSVTIPSGQGAVIGLVACLLGYVISFILSAAVAAMGVVPGPFDVDAMVELARNRMIEQGQQTEIIEAAEEMTRKFFWIFPLIGTVVYALFGAVVGAIGAVLFKKGDGSVEEV